MILMEIKVFTLRFLNLYDFKFNTNQFNYTIKKEKNLENVLLMFSYCYHIVFIL